MRSLLPRPIGFAHRGARAHASENTIEAFRLALKLGATGIASDVWVTADGEPVLQRDGAVGGRLRKRAIADLRRQDLPDGIPTLTDLYDAVGTDIHVALLVRDPAALDAVLATARAAGGDAESVLWLRHPDWTVLATWRDRTVARLADSTSLKHMKEGPERRAARLAEAGVDALEMRVGEWTAGLTTLLHRFGRLCLGTDAQFERQLLALLEMGIDGVCSDHVDRMVEAISHAER